MDSLRKNIGMIERVEYVARSGRLRPAKLIGADGVDLCVKSGPSYRPVLGWNRVAE